MDLSTALAAAPYAKKAWKLVPPNLKVPLIVAGVAYLWWSSRKDDEAAPAEA